MLTAGVTLHLILSHSLRCPADTYFTHLAMHYPHLQYPDGQTVAFGHYEDLLSDQLATKLPTDLQNVPYYCSGYRLLHWSLCLSQRSNRLPLDDVVTILKVAATLSFYVARQVRRNQESSKLLILTPHNDAAGLPSDNLSPSLHEFYLVMIYKQQLLPTTISEFTAGKQFTSHLEKCYPSGDPRQNLQRPNSLPGFGAAGYYRNYCPDRSRLSKRLLLLLHHLQHC